MEELTVHSSIQSISHDMLKLLQKTCVLMLQQIFNDYQIDTEFTCDEIVSTLLQEKIEKTVLQSTDISIKNRCLAKKKDGTQCKRKQKYNQYCGVHCKSQPYGNIIQVNPNIIKLWFQKIGNKLFLVDANSNLYTNSNQPKLIGYYKNNKVFYYDT
tara:strand:+ start:395 stop:862 length:468 start_codon:yes stop_codon:yes gene_type:complete